MHKSFTLILVVLLVVALAVPCFASEYNTGHVISDNMMAELGVPPEAFLEFDYWAVYVDGTSATLFIGNAPMYVYTGTPDWTTSPSYIKTWLKFDMQDCYVVTFGHDIDQETGEEIYTNVTLSRKVQGGDNFAISIGNVDIVITNHNIYDIDTGELVYEAFPLDYCTGESCPATDANYDNICDDCGKVLTYNMRSTLLEFAKAQAESWSETWSYYSVVAVGANTDQYNVYMSNQPQVADEEGSVVTSPNGLVRFTVSVKSDGSYEASGNYGAEEWVGNLIYSNHSIENFRQPPLAAVIQGVTGEVMKVEIPKLHRTMKILVLCGVGCLALLIGLKLFGKRSLLFLRR